MLQQGTANTALRNMRSSKISRTSSSSSSHHPRMTPGRQGSLRAAAAMHMQQMLT
jgi:hypothetical protein